MVVDAHWCVVFANRACATLFGGEVVGSNMVRHMTAIAASAAVHAPIALSPTDTAFNGLPVARRVQTVPVAGRVCQTGVRLVPRVTETLIAYDEVNRT
jgi:hypothetical protein